MTPYIAWAAGWSAILLIAGFASHERVKRQAAKIEAQTPTEQKLTEAQGCAISLAIVTTLVLSVCTDLADGRLFG